MISFPFEEEHSPLFGRIRRPKAQILLKHTKLQVWRYVNMVVDTGADYTLLPKFLSEDLGINLIKDCRVVRSLGIGGKERIYLYKSKVKVKIGVYERNISVGFLNNNFIPPLLGRKDFFETFRVVFEKFTTRFEE